MKTCSLLLICLLISIASGCTEPKPNDLKANYMNQFDTFVTETETTVKNRKLSKREWQEVENKFEEYVEDYHKHKNELTPQDQERIEQIEKRYHRLEGRDSFQILKRFSRKFFDRSAGFAEALVEDVEAFVENGGVDSLKKSAIGFAEDVGVFVENGGIDSLKNDFKESMEKAQRFLDEIEARSKK